LNEKKF
jgi:chromosome segregation ATPase